MRCPVCGHPESKVVDSRPSDEFNSIRRRRECLKDLGDIVLEHLRGLDDVAYIRFASVYKDFQTVEEFREALEGLQ